MEQTRKRNIPIATLIKNYIDKKSGKVTESRKEIQRRFDYLDWKVQKKILTVFLNSGKSDRQCAYSRALDNWDKSFEPKIKELWEEFHENICSWVVIRHFPTEYLSKNIGKFTGDRDYYFICLRLAKKHDFIIDKDKLSSTDYLAVLYHTGRNIDENEAANVLYKIVYKKCVEGFDVYEKVLDGVSDGEKGKVISPILFHVVRLAIYYLKKLNHIQTVSAFEDWNYKIQLTIFKSPEYLALCKKDLNRIKYEEAAVRIARKYAYLALDDKYKQPSCPDIESVLQPGEWFVDNLEKENKEEKQEENDSKSFNPLEIKEMIEENPALEKLIGTLDLQFETENELPF